MKRKQRTKLKAKVCAEDCYHHIFSNVLESISELLHSNTHKACCMLDKTNYNYKILSAIG